MNDYPSLDPKVPDDATELLRAIVDERQTDVKDFDNLVNRFISGRLVGKIPSGATDISPTDRVGDISFDINYMYRIVDNSGTAVWARVPLDIGW